MKNIDWTSVLIAGLVVLLLMFITAAITIQSRANDSLMYECIHAGGSWYEGGCKQ